MQPRDNKSDSGSVPAGTPLAKPRLTYFPKEDVLHLAISEGPESGSVELAPNITAELNDRGELIGVEILEAASFLRDSILESVQAKLLNITGGHP